VLKKTGIIYKIAFFRERMDEEEIQENISLCKLFWRFVVGLLTIPLLLTFGYLILGLAYFFTLLVGRKPDPNYFLNSVPREHWPSPFGFRWWPLAFLLVGIFGSLLFLHRAVVVDFASLALCALPEILVVCLYVLLVAVAMVVALPLIVFMVINTKKIWRSEVVGLVRARIKATKQRVCPIIEIER